jgi:hypothetical protein
VDREILRSLRGSNIIALAAWRESLPSRAPATQTFTEEAMAFEVGDRVVAETSGRRRRVAKQPLRPGRHGEIVRVLRGEPNPRYEIRWDQGNTTIYSPANGGLHADPSYDGPGSRARTDH